MRTLWSAACALLAGSLAAITVPTVSAAASSKLAQKSGDFCNLILQGKHVATFAKVGASVTSAAGRRAQGSLVLKGGPSTSDAALQKWIEGSQRGEHQEVKVACSRGGRAAETYDLHNAWASQIANTPKAHGQTSVRLTIRYERLSVKMGMG
jgi:hypothetical protein